MIRFALALLALLVFGFRCNPPVSPDEPVGTGGVWEPWPGTGGATAGAGGEAGEPIEPTARCQFREVRATPRAVRELDARIINGEEADLAQYTGLCSLQSSARRHVCTAELLAPDTLLTAGHCGPRVGDVVVCGCADLRSPDCQVRQVKAGYVHEAYQDWSEGHDWAMARVEAPFLGIEPIPLSEVSVPGAPTFVAGWGRTCSTCPTSTKLLEAELKLLNHAECQLAYPGSITDSMMCAVGAGKDAAPGDSGGFLGQYIDGVFAQVAGVSWGRPCTAADPGGHPTGTCVGVYASLVGEVAGMRACIGGT